MKGERLRLTGSKKCGCPFLLRGEKLPTNDEWMLHVLCGVHNHPSAEHLEGHSFAGRLSKEETSLLVDMSKSMVRPKEILVTLKQRNAFNATTIKTIYNARHRHRVVQRAGRSQMQQLLGQLAIQNYVECHRCDDREIVTDLFWAHPVSLELLRAFPHVLIMDCTYKTNRYRLPLLEIVGVTSTDLTFSVAFAYLGHEREDNYTWALGVLRTIMENTAFPKVVITDRELALMKGIAKVLPMATNLLFRTETEFNEQFSTMKTECSTYPEAIKYVTTNWLEPYKEKFVAAWTDSNMHFGNTTTNNLDKILVATKRSNSVGIDVIACGCILRRTHGLPCAHEIAEYFQQGRPIPLSCVNPYWRKLDMFPVLESAFVKLDCKTETDFFIEKFQTIDETQQGVTISTAPIRKQVQRKKAKKDNVCMTQSTNRISYFEQFSKKLRPYIRHIKDVQADGNCGFRAIAGLIGLGEDDWQQVRRNLLTELHSNVYLQPGHPVPPIVNNWIRFHHPCAIGWEKAYTIRI
ncbi:protein FAR1-RELATED SEQUENCE 3-like [Camellia sinensis]|uniref:protein FAR1-RELATED SEQUENCE 3-like n=1 Tax=Camellia sinensis TaxID=4442 RepID=UPI001035E45F|nr:protein FAR1-RELATED SEQUENCE 3-like [Camellia sinensis]